MGGGASPFFQAKEGEDSILDYEMERRGGGTNEGEQVDA